jgi:hypothetical protein
MIKMNADKVFDAVNKSLDGKGLIKRIGNGMANITLYKNGDTTGANFNINLASPFVFRNLEAHGIEVHYEISGDCRMDDGINALPDAEEGDVTKPRGRGRPKVKKNIGLADIVSTPENSGDAVA